MQRYCAHCTTPISSHALVVDERDFHGKTCLCLFLGHTPAGKDRRKPKPCRACEPGARTVVRL